ncbi:hypothetical protein V6N13_111066 [Hibiscus sabdariffa]
MECSHEPVRTKWLKNGKNKDREEVEEKAPHSITADDWDDEWDDLEDHLLIIEAAIRECFNQFKLRLDPTRQSTSTSNVHILMYFMNLGQPGQAQQSTATSNVHILPHAMNVAYPGLEQLSSSSTSNVHIFPNVMSIHTHQCR